MIKIEVDMRQVKDIFLDFYAEEMGRGRTTVNMCERAWKRFSKKLNEGLPQLRAKTEELDNLRKKDGQTKHEGIPEERIS